MWLFYPRTNGAHILYEKVLRPQLKQLKKLAEKYHNQWFLTVFIWGSSAKRIVNLPFIFSLLWKNACIPLLFIDWLKFESWTSKYWIKLSENIKFWFDIKTLSIIKPDFLLFSHYHINRKKCSRQHPNNTSSFWLAIQQWESRLSWIALLIKYSVNLSCPLLESISSLSESESTTTKSSFKFGTLQVPLLQELRTRDFQINRKRILHQRWCHRNRLRCHFLWLIWGILH